MAYTLAELAKIEEFPLKKYILQNLLRDARLMELLPWVSVDSLNVIATRWRTLPSVAFRAINGSYTASEGTSEQVWESLYALGGELQFDRVFKKVGNVIVSPMKQQTDMKVKSLALTFNDYLINGDGAVDPLGFEGLKKRVSLSPARQLVAFGASAALDVTGAVANVATFFKFLEQMITRCNGGDCQALLMNENMKLGIGHAARYVGASGGFFLSTTKDSFDRDIVTYKGVPFIDVGLKKDQSTEIITDTEVALDAGPDATSIYAVAFNDQQGLQGIQLGPLEVYDPLSGAEMSTTPANLMRLEWWLGLAGFGSYGIVRGYNVEGASNWTA